MLAFCRITGRRENRGDEKILRMDLHADGVLKWLSDAGAGRLCRDSCVDIVLFEQVISRYKITD